MLFKTPAIGAEFPLSHHEGRALLHDLDAQLQKWGLGQLVITAILRERSFYPDGSFSWHLCFCGWDLRTKGLSAQDQARIVAWLQGRSFGMKLKVDVVNEPDAARGQHIHVEIEDHDWRKRFETPGAA